MKKINAWFSGFPGGMMLLAAVSLLAAGCEFEGDSASGDSSGQVVSLSELNAENSPPTSSPTTPSAPAEPAPAPPTTPTTPPTTGTGRYSPAQDSPGQVVIPNEFLKHGAMTELRYHRASVANGLMKKISATVYSLPPLSHSVWPDPATAGKAIGTKARFADGSVYDGYVRDFTTSFPMPVQQIGQTKGGAFWVKMK